MMLKTREDLVQVVLGIDKDLAKSQKRFQRNIRKLFKDYAARVEALIRRPDTFTKDGVFELAIAQRIADQLKDLLVDAGQDDLIGDYLDEFPRLTRSALSYFEALGETPNLAGVSRESLTAYIKFTEQTLVQNFDQRLVAPIQQTLFQSVFGLQDRSVVVDAVMSTLGSISTIQAETIVSDAMAQYQRTVTVEKADALELEIYLYEGPDDDITSEQCAHMLHIDDHGLEGALYKDEISADLHENLRANPLIAGGHPRCRHRWNPVTADFAKELGFQP